MVRKENPPSREQVKRIRQLAKWYCQLGSLKAVGQKAGGLTRERVRQLLAYGRRHGVVTYSPRQALCRRIPLIPELLKTAENYEELSIGLGYRSGQSASVLLARLGVDPDVLARRFHENRRRRLVETFQAQLRAHGIDDMSTFEIAKASAPLRDLYEVMRREFGGVRAIRAALGLPAVDLRYRADQDEMRQALAARREAA